MWQRLLRRLFLPVVLIVLSSYLLGLLDALTRSAGTLPFYLSKPEGPALQGWG